MEELCCLLDVWSPVIQARSIRVIERSGLGTYDGRNVVDQFVVERRGHSDGLWERRSIGPLIGVCKLHTRSSSDSV